MVKKMIVLNCKKKTVCMSILPKCLKLRNDIQMRLYDDVLPCVHTHKYLGFNINSDVSADDDINRQMRSFYIRSNYLVRNFGICSTSVKTQLFGAYCI